MIKPITAALTKVSSRVPPLPFGVPCATYWQRECVTVGALILDFYDIGPITQKEKKYSCKNQISEKLREIALRDIKKVVAAKVIFNFKPG